MISYGIVSIRSASRAVWKPLYICIYIYERLEKYNVITNKGKQTMKNKGIPIQFEWKIAERAYARCT